MIAPQQLSSSLSSTELMKCMALEMVSLGSLTLPTATFWRVSLLTFLLAWILACLSSSLKSVCVLLLLSSRRKGRDEDVDSDVQSLPCLSAIACLRVE